MKKIVLIICLIMSFNISPAQMVQRPFPQHTLYTPGTIKPDSFTQTELDNHTGSFYDRWKSVYLRNDCGPGQYYVWFNETSDNNSICVSEGQGYGMMICAYFAGYDPNAKNYFDGLYSFYKAHPSRTNSNLMAWNQITGCIDDPDGMNSASDGDIDIAYALLLADKQWGSGGKINYLSEALKIIEALMSDDVNQNTWTVKFGDWVTSESPEFNDTRSSDFIPNHFRAFQLAANDDNWGKIIDKCYSLIDIMQTNYSQSTGLLPDFIQKCNSNPMPAGPNYLESEFDGQYFYNACRTPWRITTDYLLSGEVRAKTAIDKINNWINAKTGNDPTKIGAGYYLNGDDIPGNAYSSSAFISPLAVSAMASSTNQKWLNDIYSLLLSQSFEENTYYDNTLKMLGLIAISGNWWAPSEPSSNNNLKTERFNISVSPNPFSESTVISWQSILNGLVKIDIFNSLGNKITTLVDEWQEAGRHNLELRIENYELSAGMYFYRIQIGDRIESGKLLIVK